MDLDGNQSIKVFNEVNLQSAFTVQKHKMCTYIQNEDVSQIQVCQPHKTEVVKPLKRQDTVQLRTLEAHAHLVNHLHHIQCVLMEDTCMSAHSEQASITTD